MKPSSALAIIIASTVLGIGLVLFRNTPEEPIPEDPVRQGTSENPETDLPSLSPGSARESSANEAGTQAAAGATLESLRLAGIPVPEKVGEGEVFLAGRVVARSAATPSDQGTLEALPGVAVGFQRSGSDRVVDPIPVLQVITGADGWFFGTVKSGWNYEIQAVSPGFVEAHRSVALDAASEPVVALGDVELFRSATLHFEVTTGNQELAEEVKPVSGMTLTLHNGDPDTPLFVVNTDDRGQATVLDCPTGTLQLQGTLAPYARLAQSVEVEAPETTVRLSVDLVGHLRVRATSPGGASVREFQVTSDLERTTYAYVAPVSHPATPDPDGWVLIENLRAGQHTVYATAPGWAQGVAQGVVVEPGATTDVVIPLSAGFPLVGRVVARGTGDPIADAVVFSERDLLPSSVDTNGRSGFLPHARATRTDRDGRFRLEDLTAGAHRISAMHPDWATATVRGPELGAAGDPPSLEVPLRHGASLTGHVRDGDGRPIPGALVMVIDFLDSKNLGKKSPRMASSDPQGAYRMDHVPPGLAGVIAQMPPGVSAEASSKMQTTTFRDGTETVMDFGGQAAGSTVRGTVKDRSGRPRNDLVVMLTALDGPVSGGIPRFYQGSIAEDGGYVVQGVEPGPYSVGLANALRPSDFAGSETLTVPSAGEVIHDILADGGGLRARIVAAEDERPIADAELVVVTTSGQFLGRVASDAAGGVYIPVVPPGTHRGRIGAPGRATRSVSVTIPASDTADLGTLTLEAGGSVEATVTDVQGTPFAGAVFSLQRSGDPLWRRSATTNAQGVFRFDGLAPGTYRLVPEDPSLGIAEAEVSVMAGKAAQVHLVPR